ncbi:MAG: isochorismatase family protein [Anaerolineae bacterium]|nr:isochorismatase family protein [Anaerolineae bacterium]
MAEKVVPAASLAILICDIWDAYPARGPAERVAELAPRIHQLAEAARQRGALIIHAPSSTIDYYAGTPARQRALAAPPVDPPPPVDHPTPPLPFDSPLATCSDTGETMTHQVLPGVRPEDVFPWTRQHEAIRIDPERDAITDSGQEVYNLMHERGIRHLAITGVHTNACVLGRSFGIKQMVRWGVAVMLVRDLTDALYNPAMPPYVSHDEGTHLVVGYIEKFWCPTITSDDLVKG